MDVAIMQFNLTLDIFFALKISARRKDNFTFIIKSMRDFMANNDTDAAVIKWFGKMLTVE